MYGVCLTDSEFFSGLLVVLVVSDVVLLLRLHCCSTLLPPPCLLLGRTTVVPWVCSLPYDSRRLLPSGSSAAPAKVCRVVANRCSLCVPFYCRMNTLVYCLAVDLACSWDHLSCSVCCRSGSFGCKGCRGCRSCLGGRGQSRSGNWSCSGCPVDL